MFIKILQRGYGDDEGGIDVNVNDDHAGGGGGT
jgi:hypothetical protein